MIKRFLVCLLILGLLVVPVVAQFQVGGGFQISGYAESQQDGDYSGWLYYKILHVTGNTSVLPVGFQVNFTCWYGVGSDSANNVFLMEHSNFTDMHDLRFVDGDGWELDCWNETTVVGEYVDVWVELQSSLTVYVYYGNGLAPVVWSEEDTFIDVVGGVVGAWRLDGGVAVDLSGNGNDGVVTGAVSGSGRYGVGLVFDGDDYVTVPDDDVLDFGLGSFSVYCCVNSSVSGEMALVDKSVGSTVYLLEKESGNRAGFYFSTASGTANPVGSALINDGVWYGLLAVRGGGNVVLYQNGSMVHSDVDPTGSVSSAVDLLFGRSSSWGLNLTGV